MKLKLVAALGCIAVLVSACFHDPGGSDVVNQFSKDTTAIRSYIRQNSIAAVKLPVEGIWVISDQMGSGAHPNYSDTVAITYRMSLLPAGNVVDEQTSAPINFNLSNLIPGIQIALPLFPVGSKGRIFIPSFYGYQSNTVGSIPPNSNLIFEFSLSDVIDHHLKADTATIKQYIADHAIDAYADPSGIRYTLDTLGNGFRPLVTDTITCTYTAKTLSGTVLQQKTTVNVVLSDFFLAWKIIMPLPLVSEGAVATLYSPSTYAYGANPGTQAIPANANVIFNVKLVKINRRH